jgi:hypothetical protein
VYRERAALYYPLSFDSSVIDSKIPDTTKDGSSIALTIFTANPPVYSRVNDERLPTSQNPSPLVPGLGIQKKTPLRFSITAAPVSNWPDLAIVQTSVMLCCPYAELTAAESPIKGKPSIK